MQLGVVKGYALKMHQSLKKISNKHAKYKREIKSE